MSEYDVRMQVSESMERIERRLRAIERYQTFLMLCIVFWAVVGMLAVRVEDFRTYMACVVLLGICGFVAWYIKYGRTNAEPSARTTDRSA